jgi:hypothetical protein
MEWFITCVIKRQGNNLYLKQFLMLFPVCFNFIFVRTSRKCLSKGIKFYFRMNLTLSSWKTLKQGAY